MAESAASGYIADPLRVAIVEDEERARRTLRTLLAQDPEVHVVAETAGPSAPHVLREAQPDVVFLDIRMPGMDGLEVLEALAGDAPPAIVFVTAYDHFALDAFDVAAVDYLLKPFSDARFRTALARAKARARDPDLEAATAALRELVEVLSGDPHRSSAPSAHPTSRPAADAMVDRIVVRDGSRTLLLDPQDIDWVEADGVYAHIHVGKDEHLVRESLSALTERLEPHDFVRIHRSALVNLSRVTELRHRSHGDWSVMLDDGTQLKLSRTRRVELERRLGESLS
ncbi:MAG: LytTR family DNA-binding domain-containing protein [Gemmatimonadota bacterium]|jgi:two-component system LytT family response regulator